MERGFPVSLTQQMADIFPQHYQFVEIERRIYKQILIFAYTYREYLVLLLALIQFLRPHTTKRLYIAKVKSSLIVV